MAKFNVGDKVIGSNFHWNEELSTKGKIKGKRFSITGVGDGDKTLVSVSPPVEPLNPAEWFDVRRFDLDKSQESVEKTPFQLLFLLPSLKDVADVFGEGEKKYPNVNGDFSWRSRVDRVAFKLERFGSCLRHIAAHMSGEKIDPEFGKPHLAHAICNLLMISDVENLESK